MSRAKLLVRTTNWIGDVVMNLPAIDVLRHNFPEAEIHAAARPWAGALFQFRPDLIDRWHAVDDKSSIFALWRPAKALREEKFTHAFVFTNHIKGALLTWLARVPKRIGFLKSDTRLFLHDGIKRSNLPKSGRHQSRDYVDLLIASGLEMPAGNVYPRPVLHRDATLADAAIEKHLADAPRPWLLIHAGAAFGTAKRWLPERYTDVCRRFLDDRGGSVVLLGVAAERDVNDSIAAALPGAVNLCGKTSLTESLALIGEADAFLSNDSGLMHAAAAFGVPQVAIYGPTDVHATFPDNPKASIQYEQVTCSPCFERHCPIGHDCMKAVTADAVWDGLRDVLDSKSPVDSAS